MSKLLPLFAALGAAFAVSTAQAVVLLIDDFNLPVVQQQNGDTTVNGVELELFAPQALPGQIGGTRCVFNNLMQNGSNLLNPVIVTIGGGAGGNMDIQNGAQANSTVRLQYNTNAFTLTPGPVSIVFALLFSDNGVPNVNTTLNFVFDGAGMSDFSRMLSLPETLGTNFSFDLNATEAGFFAAGGLLNLTFAGTTSFDLTIDQIAVEIPEPTSLALAGLALLGAGVASRRRKA